MELAARVSDSSLLSRSGCSPVLAGIAVCAEDGDGSVGEELRSGVLFDVGDGFMKLGLAFKSGVIGSMATDGVGTNGWAACDCMAMGVVGIGLNGNAGCAGPGLGLIVARTAGSFFAPSAIHLKNGWLSGPGNGCGGCAQRLPKSGYPAGLYEGCGAIGVSFALPTCSSAFEVFVLSGPL